MLLWAIARAFVFVVLLSAVENSIQGRGQASLLGLGTRDAANPDVLILSIEFRAIAAAHELGEVVFTQKEADVRPYAREVCR